MLYLLLKSTSPDTRIGVFNLKHEIDKSTLANFVNNIKYIIDDMSSNYSIIVDRGELHEDYVSHIFRSLLLDPNSTFNSFIKRTKDDWETGTDVPSVAF